MFAARTARRASAAFADATVAASKPGLWLGLEHEFLVHDRRGRRLDFGTIVDDLGLGPGRLSPADAHAHPLPSGSVVTADMREAEIALPPTTVEAGFAQRLDAAAHWEREALAARIPGLRLTGDSTHLSVMLPDDVDADAVALQFAARFAVGQMLLMDRRQSPGLIVRPRPGRLEIGGEYVVGDALRASAAYAVGATLACVESVRSGSAEGLPPALAGRVERNVMRYGWYVSRTAFGGDLYSTGRRAVLRSVEGKAITANEAFGRCWSVARAHLEGRVDSVDLADADQLVDGQQALVIERPTSAYENGLAQPAEPRSPFGDVLEPRARGEFECAPVLLTWQLAVFLMVRSDRGRSAFAAVPGRHLDGYLDALAAGRLDQPVGSYLATGRVDRPLLVHAQVASPGLYDQLGLRAALLMAERDYWGRPMRLVARTSSALAHPAGRAA